VLLGLADDLAAVPECARRTALDAVRVRVQADTQHRLPRA